MNSEKYVGEERGKTEISAKRRMIKSCLRNRILIVGTMILFCVMSPNAALHAQTNEDFDVSKIIKQLQKRFNLTAKDVACISPLLNRENNNVAAIYARFSGDGPEYSMRVWQVLIASRYEFLARPHGDLTKRQWVALRAARSRLETRVLGYLVNDYVEFLAEYLEVGRWEYEHMRIVFELDKSRKLRLVDNADLANISGLQKEVEKITDETERALRRLLTEDQWRGYQSLMESQTQMA